MQTTQPRVTGMVDRHERFTHTVVWVSVQGIDALDISVRHDGEVHIVLENEDAATVDKIGKLYDAEPAARETQTGYFACNYSVRIEPNEDRPFAIWLTTFLTAWPTCKRCDDYQVDHPGSNCPTCTTAMGALEAV